MGAKPSTVAQSAGGNRQSSTGENETTMQSFSLRPSLPEGVSMLQHQHQQGNQSQASRVSGDSRQRARSLSYVPERSLEERERLDTPSGVGISPVLGLTLPYEVEEDVGGVYAGHSLPSHMGSLNENETTMQIFSSLHSLPEDVHMLQHQQQQGNQSQASQVSGDSRQCARSLSYVPELSLEERERLDPPSGVGISPVLGLTLPYEGEEDVGISPVFGPTVPYEVEEDVGISPVLGLTLPYEVEEYVGRVYAAHSMPSHMGSLNVLNSYVRRTDEQKHLSNLLYKRVQRDERLGLCCHHVLLESFKLRAKGGGYLVGRMLSASYPENETAMQIFSSYHSLPEGVRMLQHQLQRGYVSQASRVLGDSRQRARSLSYVPELSLEERNRLDPLRGDGALSTHTGSLNAKPSAVAQAGGSNGQSSTGENQTTMQSFSLLPSLSEGVSMLQHQHQQGNQSQASRVSGNSRQCARSMSYVPELSLREQERLDPPRGVGVGSVLGLTQPYRDHEDVGKVYAAHSLSSHMGSLNAKPSAVAQSAGSNGQSSTGENETTMQSFSLLPSLPEGVSMLQHQHQQGNQSEASRVSGDSRECTQSLSYVPELSLEERERLESSRGVEVGPVLGLLPYEVEEDVGPVYAAHSLPSHMGSLNVKPSAVAQSFRGNGQSSTRENETTMQSFSLLPSLPEGVSMLQRQHQQGNQSQASRVSGDSRQCTRSMSYMPELSLEERERLDSPRGVGVGPVRSLTLPYEDDEDVGRVYAAYSLLSHMGSLNGKLKGS